jgi:hypothetical protein
MKVLIHRRTTGSNLITTVLCGVTNSGTSANGRFLVFTTPPTERKPIYRREFNIDDVMGVDYEDEA